MIKTLFLAICLLLVQMATAQTCRDTIPAGTPDSRFTVNGDEVTDAETGLIWQRCSLGQTGSDCSGSSANTYSWQGALQAAGAPWRLPNVIELRSIVEDKCFSPAINLTIFPNTVSSDYWSASPDANSSDNAWNVYFSNGGSHDDAKSYYRHVRLVRDGHGSTVDVIAPSSKNLLAGEEFTHEFQILNLGPVTDTFDLFLTHSLDWYNLSGVPSAIDVSASGTVTVDIPGTVPISAITGQGDTLSMQAVSQSAPLVNDTAETKILVVESNPPSSCVDSFTVKCMGALPVWPSGTLRNQHLNAGQTHVWHFDYSAAQNGEGRFTLYNGRFKVLSTSLIANDFTLNFPCQITQVSVQQPLRYAAAWLTEFDQCGFEDGKRYFLNIKSTVTESDPYTLFVE